MSDKHQQLADRLDQLADRLRDTHWQPFQTRDEINSGIRNVAEDLKQLAIEQRPPGDYNGLPARLTAAAWNAMQYHRRVVPVPLAIIELVEVAREAAATVLDHQKEMRAFVNDNLGERCLSLNEVREFIGFVSGDVPELHSVEVPKLADSLARFLEMKAQS